MAKSKLTEDLEYALFHTYHIKKSTRCALEVFVPYGRVDFMAISKDDEITCIEIKVSKQDFLSKNGHNFFGNKNYYAVPEFLSKEIIELVPPTVGVMEVSFSKTGNPIVKIVKNSKKIKHEYMNKVIDDFRYNMWVALNSNMRRMLRDRYLRNHKSDISKTLRTKK